MGQPQPSSLGQRTDSHSSENWLAFGDVKANGTNVKEGEVPAYPNQNDPAQKYTKTYMNYPYLTTKGIATSANMRTYSKKRPACLWILKAWPAIAPSLTAAPGILYLYKRYVRTHVKANDTTARGICGYPKNGRPFPPK